LTGHNQDVGFKERSTKIREGISRRMLSVGFIRRWYARRLVKFIAKSKKKGRRLPDHLFQLDRTLKKVPEARRTKTVEEMLIPRNEEEYGRELRRAASRQERRGGQGGASRRPGSPPQVVRRQVKR
jgi:hypothetical protein